jgi:hypothetical protein
LAVLAAALLSSPALAQDASTVGGNGIKVGQGRVHPYVDEEMHFDSAAGYFGQSGVISNQLSPEAIAHVRPGLRLNIPTPSLLIDASGFVDWVQYTGILTPGSQVASRLEAGADFSASYNAQGAVELRVADHFQRSDRTTNVVLGVGIISLYNELKTSLAIHPGGGALEITPELAWAFELFDPLAYQASTSCTQLTCDPTQVRGMNYQHLAFGLDGRWKFLPKTALVVEADFAWRRYASVVHPAGLLFRSMAGMAGLVTSKLSVVAKAGWGQDFGLSQGRSFISHLEAAYRINEASSLRAGYLRSLELVPTFGAYTDNRWYADARWMVNGNLTLHGMFALDDISFHSGSGRSDRQLTFDVGPEYRFNRWIYGALSYFISSRFSNDSTALGTNYVRHEGLFRLTVTY